MARIFDNLSCEHEFAVGQNEMKQWAIFEDGEDVLAQRKRAITSSL